MTNVPVVLKIQNGAGLNLYSTCLDSFKVILTNMQLFASSVATAMITYEFLSLLVLKWYSLCVA